MADYPSLYAEAVALAKKGFWSEAEATFLQAARLRPDASLTWLGAAVAACHQKRFDVAATAAEWALRAVPIRDSPEIRAATAAFERSDWHGVVAALGNPSGDQAETPSHLLLAIAHHRLGDVPSLVRHLSDAYTLEWSSSR